MLGFKKKREVLPGCAAIVAAAGQSSRMGGESKMFALLDGVPVLVRACRALNDSALINEIVIAVRESDLIFIGNMIKDYGITKVTRIVRGGDTRQESVSAALSEISDSAEFVAIHDGARPLVSQELISAVIRSAFEYGAAVPVVPVKDTIKIVRGNVVTQTPERQTLFSVQTPQVFQRPIITAALIKARSDFTDDSSAVEMMGVSVHTVDGDYRNIKITTPEDLATAEAML